ncbi:uncharacterized protein BXZ73DRAFT_79816 [Epithele typhae]|uniref:uncharacterized protein n=1 Tax=Epithele typhae TaxID=378194 RepID=UPI0020082568|nr:uncharacterized protein BXZ73DRAFT_79816 [Epithele typhae]KAH9922027.1 hypothetical protein BXZ73DRAFT_79816 [Epithele typhae]
MKSMAEEEYATLTKTMSKLVEDTFPALLVPASKTSHLSAILEIRAGVGGSESALFVEDLIGMYTGATHSMGWSLTVLNANPLDAGGIKDAIVEVKGEGAYDALRWESGVHRVQRVPATESNGRVHTSTVSIMTLPLIEESSSKNPDDELFKMDDVRIEVMRARGAGGQHVNKTESAVRLTHVPTGITVSMQDERSQHQNRRRAFQVLRARLMDRKLNEDMVQRREMRRSLVSSADRSEKIRTYNYAQDRITDHRIAYWDSVRLNEILMCAGFVAHTRYRLATQPVSHRLHSMLGIWKDAEAAASSTSNSSKGSPRAHENEYPSKKRNITPSSASPESHGLPRPATSPEEVYTEVTQGNAIVIIESLEEKMRMFRTALGQSIVIRQTIANTGSHRIILFVVDDDNSIDQYAAALESMDFTVGSYTLPMHTSGQNQWPNVIFNDIVVVPANASAFSYPALEDGNVKLSQAHLIVISDAQRVVPMVNPHPVLRIVSEHYYAKTTDRPRILATLTSPPDRWQHIDLQHLEQSLDARSFFLVTKSLDSWFGPMELVTEYDSLGPLPKDSPLSSDLRKADPNGVVLKDHHFQCAGRIFSQLGNHATKLYWRSVYDEVSRSPDDEVTLTKMDVLTNMMGESLNIDIASPAFNTTPKMVTLLQILQTCAQYGDNFRGAIFVNDALVADKLTEQLNSNPGRLSFIHASTVRKGQENDVLGAFDAGDYNLLVLTRSFADTDSLQCSVVICKGRHSHLIHMVEKGNNEHRNLLARLLSIDGDLKTWIANAAHGTSRVPPRSTWISTDPYKSEDEQHAKNEIVDPTTGARVDKAEAVTAMYRYIAEVDGAMLPGEINVSLTVEEGSDSEEGLYSELASVGLLSHRHFPHPRTPILTSEPNPTSLTPLTPVQTANTSAQTHGYPRATPTFWRHPLPSPSDLSAEPTTLYPTVLVPDSTSTGAAHAPIALLTRAPLPPLAGLALFPDGHRTDVHAERAAPLVVSPAQLRDLHGYTLRATRSLTNKPFDCGLGGLLAYVAPLAGEWRATRDARWPLPQLAAHVPWDAVRLAADFFAVPVLGGAGGAGVEGLDEMLQDAIVIDRKVEHTLRHFVVKVRHDLTPSSKAEDSPREAEFSSFLEYCKARRKDFQGLEYDNQPMIEVSAVPSAANLLHPTGNGPTTPTAHPLKYLIPEFAYKFTIPASTYRTLLLLPSLSDKLDALLLTKELNARLLHGAALEPLLLAALSARAAWTDANYERLEFLGDAFLKALASAHAFAAAAPGTGVGALHAARKDVVSNRALRAGATAVGLPSFVRHKRFVAKMWHPPVRGEGAAAAAAVERKWRTRRPVGGEKKGGKDKGKRSKKQRQLEELNTLWMGDKIVADVVEAILAAAFLSAGHEGGLQAARSLRVPLPNVAQWGDFARILAQNDAGARGKRGARATRACLGRRGFGEGFFRTIGDMELMMRFRRMCPLDTGRIMKNWSSWAMQCSTFAAMVSNHALAAFCVHANLHHHIRFESPDLRDAIEKYVGALGALRKKEYTSAESEQRLPGQYWLELPMEPPKVLSDVVEALVGALYVGDNFFEPSVGRFFDGAFRQFVEAHIRLQTLSANPKATILELLQAEGCQECAVVKRPSVKASGPVQMEVVIHGKVLASATDASAAVATRQACMAALDTLATDPELLARTCDCKAVPPAGAKRYTRIYKYVSRDEGDGEAGGEVDEDLGTERGLVGVVEGDGLDKSHGGGAGRAEGDVAEGAAERARMDMVLQAREAQNVLQQVTTSAQWRAVRSMFSSDPLVLGHCDATADRDASHQDALAASLSLDRGPVGKLAYERNLVKYGRHKRQSMRFYAFDFNELDILPSQETDDGASSTNLQLTATSAWTQLAYTPLRLARATSSMAKFCLRQALALVEREAKTAEIPPSIPGTPDPNTHRGSMPLKRSGISEHCLSIFEDDLHHRFHNCVWLVLNDAIIGVAFGTFLCENQYFLARWLQYGLRIYLVDGMEDALLWLNNWPAGLKLNTELSQFYCHSLIGFVSAWGCCLGMTTIVSLLSDALSLLTAHLYLCYFISATVFSKRYNVLRNRIDSWDYDLDQLLLGTILFTLVAFLCPTAHLLRPFATARLTVIVVHAGLDTLTALLNHFPLFALMLRVKDPLRVPGGVCIQRSQGTAHPISHLAGRLAGHYHPVRMLRHLASGRLLHPIPRSDIRYSMIPSPSEHIPRGT